MVKQQRSEVTPALIYFQHFEGLLELRELLQDIKFHNRSYILCNAALILSATHTMHSLKAKYLKMTNHFSSLNCNGWVIID